MSGELWTDLPALEPAACDLRQILSAADLALLDGLPSPPAAVVEHAVFGRMMQHLREDHREQMGILCGRVVTDALRGCTLVLVEKAYPLRGALGTRTSVQATAASWALAWKQFDSCATVGWYHSHPEMGVFFSETDRRTQRTHFAQPWQVGLVVDPSTGAAGVFVGPDALPGAWLAVESIRLR